MAPANIVPLVRKLESVSSLSGAEIDAFASVPIAIRELRADQDIIREGDMPSHCCLMLRGFTCSYKMTSGGRRQIMSFHVPGDIPDLQSLHLDVQDHSLATVSPSQVGLIAHQNLRDLFETHPRLAEAFWRDTMIGASVYREWLVNIGRRTSYERIAHLLCELFVRLEVVGLTHEHTCELPLTQIELADALGISTVHVNRVIRELRKDELVTLSATSLVVLDWERLQQVAGFDPTYLHLRRPWGQR